MVPDELHSHLGQFCGLAGAPGRGESEPMEGHQGFLGASLHSKPYIVLIGHTGDDHGISNRGKDDMSRDSPLPGAPARPQNWPRWECNSSGTISTRCDEPLDTRVYIGLESTLGLLTLARTDKLSMFVVHACLRECQKAPILALYSISGDSGRNLPVVLARQLGLSS